MPRLTHGHIVFDCAIGIALPLICLYLDPIVFRATGFGEPLLADHFVAASLAIGLGMVSLTSWLVFQPPSALMAGLLAGAAIFATLLGLFLLPLSIIGLSVGIGLLGLSPFLTAFVYLEMPFLPSVNPIRAGSHDGSC